MSWGPHNCYSRSKTEFISSALIRNLSSSHQIFSLFHTSSPPPQWTQALVYWHCSVCKGVPQKFQHIFLLSPLSSAEFPTGSCLVQSAMRRMCVNTALLICCRYKCPALAFLCPYLQGRYYSSGWYRFWTGEPEWVDDKRFLYISILFWPKSSLGFNSARSLNTSESRIWLRECFPVLFPTAFHYHLLNL